MQSIVRHDYYPPSVRTRSRRGTAQAAFAPVETLSAEDAAVSRWRLPATDLPVRTQEKRLDVFRLVAALLGLTLYLGLPIAGLAYLALAFMR